MRVALYMRRSTNEELQADSLAVQEEILARFASDRQLDIVRVFSESASGRSADGRTEFVRLMDLVTSDRHDFDAVLVRDVSRWGRFDNADEAAYWDFLAFRHGVEVIYVEESFGRDSSPYAGLMKAMKRVQAAEFSREKSRIITYGKRRGAEHGFRVGAPPPYGMKRILVSQDGAWMQDLPRTVHKLVSSVKTKLAPAGDETQDVVLRIYDYFVRGKMSYGEIARTLNRDNVRGPHEGKWHAPTVRYILGNEAYAGTAIYRSSHFKEPIRVENAHEPLVERSLFSAAAVRQEEISHLPRLTRSQHLAEARDALQRWGHLSADLIKAIAPSGATGHELIATAWRVDEICSNLIAEERPHLVTLLKPSFEVVEEPSKLTLNGTLSVAFVIGFPRSDLVRQPSSFDFSVIDADVFVGVMLDTQLKVAGRCVGLRQHVGGRRILRYRDRVSRILPSLDSLASVLPLLQRQVRRTNAAAVLAHHLRSTPAKITISGLSRSLGWSIPAIKRSLDALEESGFPVPELRNQIGRRTTITCSRCGVERSFLPSDAKMHRTDLCARCSRGTAGKLSTTCPACGKVRWVWPSGFKKLSGGALTPCHECALAAGREARRIKVDQGRVALAQKYDLLRSIAAIVLRRMTSRSLEFKNPRLSSLTVRRLPTLSWRSGADQSAQALTLDCSPEFVEKCEAAPRQRNTSNSIADFVMDRSCWLTTGVHRGTRQWLVRLN